jgi:hypothetical protein
MISINNDKVKRICNSCGKSGEDLCEVSVMDDKNKYGLFFNLCKECKRKLILSLTEVNND